MKHAFQSSLVSALTGVLLALSCSGCGGPSKPDWPDAVPVSGEVLMDGKPLASASVRFIPAADTVGPGGAGMTDESGKYTATSATSDGKITDGLIPGQYKVAVSRFVKPDGSVWTPQPGVEGGPMMSGAREAIPQRFSDPASSRLTAKVDQGGGTFKFEVSAK